MQNTEIYTKLNVIYIYLQRERERERDKTNKS